MVPLLLGSEILEKVDSYRYLGVKISCKLTWTDYIEQVSTKARRLVGMLHRQFYSWADKATLLNLTLPVCLHSVGSLNLQEHLYARASPKVCM